GQKRATYAGYGRSVSPGELAEFLNGAGRPGQDRPVLKETSEILREVLRAGVAFERLFFEAFQAYRFQVARQFRLQPARRHRVLRANLLQRLQDRRTAKRRPTR